MDWIQIVQETRSTETYTREIIPRKHKFKLASEKKNIHLLRIDVTDRFYLHSFSLIYRGEGGEELGSK